jgi:anti-anti-sigma factor
MSDPIAGAVIPDVILVLTVNVPEVRGERVTAELEQTFSTEVSRTGATKVVVDLTAVTYITSTGVSTLLTLYQQVKAVGGRVVLCGLSETVSDGGRSHR